MPALAADESLIGRVLADKYRILRVIGKGGMGVVYEAEHMVLGKRVAIKLMLDKYFEDGEAKARFRREAQAASMIGNPHIIDVVDVGTSPDGTEYVVMELLEGKPLSDVIEQGGPMPPWRAVAIMRQVLRAIGVAHSKGIIHRDLKPDNIFLIGHDAQHDFVKLLDFGISKVLSADEQIAFTKLTTTGVVMGTPLYMSPEQAMGQTSTAAADIYACGVILYEMLSGRTPFVGNTYAVLVAQLLTAPPEPLQNLRPGLPQSLVNAVHRALEKEPERRFASAEMFAASLPGERSASQIELAGTLDSGIAVARVAPTKRRGRGTLLAIGGALLLGAATAGVLIATQRGAGDQQQQQQAKPEPPPEPKPDVKPIAPETPPQTGLLKLASTPDGATAYVDGSHIGATPCEVTLKPGKHTVRFELIGYEPIETQTEVDVGSNRFSTSLVKAKKPTISSGRPSTPVGISRPSTPTGPTGPSTPKTVGKGGPDSDLPPSMPVGPQKPEPEPKKPPPPAIEQPKGNGKENPYTKPNPYKQ